MTFFQLRIKTFQKDCQNSNLHFHMNFLKKIFASKSLWCGKFRRASSEKNASMLSNFKSSFPEEQILKKHFFEKKYRFIDFVRASSEKFPAGLSKLHSIFPEEHFARNFLSEKIYKFMNVLRASVENFLAGVSKLLSIYSADFFRGKLLSEKVIGSKCFFGLRLKNFRKFCQNCFLIFQRKILGENFYSKELTNS